MIDALFGSKTRVKLLHLFFNNPDKSFYVREITRLIDEQINSVRRELSNMLEIGIITSDSAENKLYYQVNSEYEFYSPFRMIFAADQVNKTTLGKKPAASTDSDAKWQQLIRRTSGIRIAVIAGALVRGSASPIDLLLVGNLTPAKRKSLLAATEKEVGRELNYSVLSYDEFYYRLSVRDKFINEILTNQHEILVDTDNVLK